MAATDAFVHPPSLQTIPPEHAFNIVPSDSAQIAYVTRALFIGTGGNVAVTMAAGEAAVFRNVADGTLLPIRVVAVRATGTTADNILGLY